MTKEKTLLFLCLIAGGNAVFAQTFSPAPSIQIIVARMMQARAANDSRIRPYTVTRDYRLFGNQESTAKSRVIADVTFVPPGQKGFFIRQTSGTGLGEKVVRRMLSSEVELANDSSSDLTTENYDFSLLGQASLNGRRCYLLGLKPRRKDKHLMIGRAWVDVQNFLIHRTEGEPAKKPSWWVRDLHFALSYGNVGGMWLPTGIEARADVRILGQCKLVSHNVGIRTGQVADNAN